MDRRQRLTLRLIGLCSCLVPVAPAQAQVRAITLGPATATLSEEFTNIRAVRELADGRVLVTDDKENRLVVADFKDGAVRALGRTGRGPGEFARAGRLFAIRGDSTILRDDENGGWLLLAHDSIVTTLTPNEGIIKAAAGTLVAADSSGNILVRRSAPAVDLGQGMRRWDAFAVRFDRATLHADTIAALAGALLKTTSTTSGGNTTNTSWQVMFSFTEQALLFPDGWTAIARSDPYRVDWHPPRGAPRLGKPLPWTRVKVTEAEKASWQLRVMRESGTTQRWDLSAVPFAEVIPAVASTGLLAAPDGRLLVLRHFSSDAPRPRLRPRRPQRRPHGDASSSGHRANPRIRPRRCISRRDRRRRHPAPTPPPLADPMTERRFSEEEVAEIFGRASEAEEAGKRQAASPSSDGMTLAQLQDIGKEAGIDPARVAEAAHALDRPAIPRMKRRFLGMTIGVGRTIELDRKITDDEWERVVVLLRETFDARGRVKAYGSMREWTNGNLQALLEPTATGHRIRLRTMHGASRALMTAGVAMLAAAGTAFVVSIAGTGFPGTDVLERFGTLGLIGGVLYVGGLVRLPGWARRRQEQMDEIAEVLKTGLDR